MPEEGEPYWLPSDRQKISAWLIEKRLTCNRCGSRRDEFDEDPIAYVAEASRCPGCERIEIEQDAWRRDDANTFGLQFALVRPDEVSTVRMPGSNPP